MTPPQILIVEDERIVARDLQCRLKRMGYGVPGLATSGEGAIRHVEQSPPDLVLMDIILDGAMDGIQAAEEIQNRYRTPVVYVTAHADETTFERAKRTRPCGYLVKPYEDGELKRVVELALHKHHRPGEAGWLETPTPESETA